MTRWYCLRVSAIFNSTLSSVYFSISYPTHVVRLNLVFHFHWFTQPMLLAAALLFAVWPGFARSFWLEFNPLFGQRKLLSGLTYMGKCLDNVDTGQLSAGFIKWWMTHILYVGNFQEYHKAPLIRCLGTVISVASGNGKDALKWPQKYRRVWLCWL